MENQGLLTALKLVDVWVYAVHMTGYDRLMGKPWEKQSLGTANWSCPAFKLAYEGI